VDDTHCEHRALLAFEEHRGIVALGEGH
jgi:hypothetical protein